MTECFMRINAIIVESNQDATRTNDDINALASADNLRKERALKFGFNVKIDG